MGLHRTVPIGIVVALGLVVLAVVTVRDLVVDRGWSTGRAVAARPAEPARRSRADAPACSRWPPSPPSLGLVLLVIGLTPAPRRHARAQDSEQLWSSPAAVAAVARAAADRPPAC